MSNAKKALSTFSSKPEEKKDSTSQQEVKRSSSRDSKVGEEPDRKNKKPCSHFNPQKWRNTVCRYEKI
jgi:hypothetical protein